MELIQVCQPNIDRNRSLDAQLTLGELQITASVAVVGPGARRLTVQRSFGVGAANFRIFKVPNNSLANVSIRGLTIKNGNAGSDPSGGGGIYIQRGSVVTLSDVAVSNNTAVVGGGIANEGILNLTRSLINSNTAGSQGGAILNLDDLSQVTITNTTITNNSAVTAGAISNNGALLLINNTISSNLATNVASSIVNGSGGTISVLNTIIGNDAASSVNTLSGAFISLGNNLITDARGSAGFANGVNNDQVSDNNVINPLLGDLTDNNGQTDTRSLQTGSPAIDAGNSCVRMPSCASPIPSNLLLRWDQRYGYSRLAGASVDIGAFEAGATISTGGLSFVFAILSPSARRARDIAILTNARTGEKLYRVINPFGSFRFDNLASGEIYILEIRSKSGFFTPAVFEF